MSMRRKNDRDDTIEESTGNVFADLGFADAETELAKADLAIQIARAIKERHLSQVQAARALGLQQPNVSAIVRGRLEGFSTDRLMRCLVALGKDVQIIVGKRRSGRRRISVRRAA